MTDQVHKAIISVFDEAFKREIAEADLVRAEIKQKGTYWAGDQIWSLRRTVAALRTRIAKMEGNEP